MDFTRQTRIFDPDKQKHNIKVFGVGSTGSFITLTLAKMGFKNISVYDFDVVEGHNIPNQFYREQDINKLKVEALKEIIKDFTNEEIQTNNLKIEENSDLDFDLNSIFVLCVDNMETRKLIYNKIKEYPIKLIDTRFGSEGFSIYSVDLSKEEDKTLFEKSLNLEIKPTLCGEKSVIYTILSLSSEVTNIIKKIDKQEGSPKILKRELKTYRFIGA